MAEVPFGLGLLLPGVQAVIHVALLEPEIAGNAGSAARTCLAAGARLHLIRPLGFRLSGARLKRAGMDYWGAAEVTVHDGFAAFAEAFAPAFAAGRVFAMSTKGRLAYTEARYRAGDVLLYGPESRGLPEEVRALAQVLRIPMRAEARSLNLAVSVALGVYEAWRQQGFDGGS